MLNDIVGFLKFQGNEKYIDTLMNGEIYCNTKNYFATLSCEDLIGDKYENIIYIDHSEAVKIPVNLNISYVTAIRQKDGTYHSLAESRDESINLFCLYAIRLKNCVVQDKSISFTIPEELKTSAAYFLLILFPSEFISKIIKAINDQELKYKCSVVKYDKIGDKYGFKSYFHKPVRYAIQNEFRIVIYSKEDKPITLNIGNLNSISKKVPMNCKTVVLNGIDETKSKAMINYKWPIEHES